MAICSLSYLLGKIHWYQTPRFSHKIKRWVGGFVRLSILTFWGRFVLICRNVLNNYMVDSCFWPPPLFFLWTCITRITLLWVQFLGLVRPGCTVYYIEKHVIHLGFNVYNIEKHVIRLGFQSVLNRKACYTPRFSKCIKSKSMLYNPIFAKFSVYNMFFSLISGIFLQRKI